MTESERIARAQAKRARRGARRSMREIGAWYRADALRYALAGIASVHRHERAWSTATSVRDHSADGRAWDIERARDRWEDESIDLAIRTTTAAAWWHGHDR